MLRTAFLCVEIRVDGPLPTCVICGVFSSPASGLTARKNTVFADLPVKASAETFQEAHDIVVKVCKTSPPEMRHVTGFGLGSEPESSLSYLEEKHTCPEMVSLVRANEIESYASLMGILIERLLGLDWETTLDEHLWRVSYYGSSHRHYVGKITRMTNRLVGLGVLDENLFPMHGEVGIIVTL